MHLPHSISIVVGFITPLVLFTALASKPQSHKPPATTPTVSLAGKYSVAGTNPADGGEYVGSLEVISRGNVYQFRWNAGNQYEGIGVKNGNTVAVAFTSGSDGSGCGVVDYTVLKDGTLDGIWGYWGTDASGTERAKHVNGSGLEGAYAATGSNPDGKRYQANLSVQAAGRGYRFVWSNSSEGFGIRRGDNVAVGIGGERCGFVAYEVRPDGSLDGIWGGYGSQLIGTEKATKQ
jgi:hypothetical protein